MEDIIVLITGAGAPGIRGTLYSLHNNYEGRKIKTIGVDIREGVIGKYLCDKFYQIKKPSEQTFISDLISISKKEKVDVLLPQVTKELDKLSKYKEVFEGEGIKVAISDNKAINIANDKYKLIKKAEKINLPVSKCDLVSNWNDLTNKVKSYNYPENNVVIKYPLGNGMRGFRVLSKKNKSKDDFYTQKPTGIHTNLDLLHTELGDEFKPVMIMEFLPGAEFTVDVLRKENNMTIIIPRKREQIRSGITFLGITEKRDDIIEFTQKLSEKINLEYAFGFQFKEKENGMPILLESNPRIQGTMVLSTLSGANIIYGSVKQALDEEFSVPNIKWGTKFLRYWGGLGINGQKVVEI